MPVQGQEPNMERNKFYSSSSLPATIKIPHSETGCFYDKDRRPSRIDDSDRETFKVPFDYSQLDNYKKK